MQIQIDIGFEQLVQLVKALPPKQLKQLKAEIAGKSNEKKTPAALEALLLDGPVATEQQLEVINENRKAIDQWRIK